MSGGEGSLLVKVSTSERPPRQLVIDIEVEQERLDRATDEAFKRIAGRVNVPGFRKGKAPRAMVERVVGRESIVEDALEHLVPDVVNEAVDEVKVEAYGRPRVENIDMNPLRVTAVVPLAPKVELGAYAQELRIEAEAVQVADEEIDRVIERLRESNAQWVPVERPVQVGDRIGLDILGEALEEERTFLDSKDAEYVVDAEGPQPAPGFAEAVIGIEAGGEKVFTHRLPEDYRDTKLAGQEVRFTVRLHWVKEKQLPALDEDFARQVGEFETVDAVREAVEENLRTREEQRVQEANQSAALDKLVEISTIEVPPQTVEHQAQHMLEQFVTTLERQGLKLEQYLKFMGRGADAFREEVRGDAEKRLLRSLALDAFVDAEKLEVTADEVEAEIKKGTAEAANPADAEAAALGNPETRARIEGAIKEQRALARLVEVATQPDATGSDSGTTRKTATASKKQPKKSDAGEPSETDTGTKPERKSRSTPKAASGTGTAAQEQE